MTQKEANLLDQLQELLKRGYTPLLDLIKNEARKSKISEFLEGQGKYLPAGLLGGAALGGLSGLFRPDSSAGDTLLRALTGGALGGGAGYGLPHLLELLTQEDEPEEFFGERTLAGDPEEREGFAKDVAALRDIERRSRAQRLRTPDQVLGAQYLKQSINRMWYENQKRLYEGGRIDKMITPPPGISEMIEKAPIEQLADVYRKYRFQLPVHPGKRTLGERIGNVFAGKALWNDKAYWWKSVFGESPMSESTRAAKDLLERTRTPHGPGNPSELSKQLQPILEILKDPARSRAHLLSAGGTMRVEPGTEWYNKELF
jgi:hypothetical protein